MQAAREDAQKNSRYHSKAHTNKAKKSSSLNVSSMNTPHKNKSTNNQIMKSKDIQLTVSKPVKEGVFISDHKSKRASRGDISPMSNRSLGSDQLAASIRSPRGSNYEN